MISNNRVVDETEHDSPACIYIAYISIRSVCMLLYELDLTATFFFCLLAMDILSKDLRLRVQVSSGGRKMRTPTYRLLLEARPAVLITN